VSMRGVRTEGAMAPDIALDKQRPAEYTFNKEVAIRLDQIGGRATQTRPGVGAAGVPRAAGAPVNAPEAGDR